jgi:hypothetical protein
MKFFAILTLSGFVFLNNVFATNVAYFGVDGNPNVTSAGWTNFVKELTKNTSINQLTLDCSFSEEDADVVGNLLSKRQFMPTNFSNMTSSGKAIQSLFSYPYNYLLQNSSLSAEQNKALNSVFQEGVTVKSWPWIENTTFDNGCLLTSDGKITITDTAYAGFSDPLISCLTDEMAIDIVNNTAAVDDLNINWSNSSVTSEPLVNLINKATDQNGKNESISLALFNMKDLNYDDLYDPLQKYMQTFNPALGTFIFSGKNGNSDQLLHTLLQSATQLPSFSIGKSMNFVGGNLESLSIDDWTVLFANYNNINFYGNKLGGNISNITSALKNRPKNNYFWFNIGMNNIDDEGAADLFSSILDSFENNPPRAGFFFGFGGNPLTDVGVDALAAFLTKCSEKKYRSAWSQFSFDGSSFAEDEWIKIFDALKSIGMSSISLNKCRFTPNALKSLGNLLVASPDAWFVNLTSCEIDDAQITGLAEGLEGIKGIPYLTLRSNKIGDNGATALANVLKTASVETQSVVDLSDNPITSVGANALLQVSSANGLISLDLGNNPINVDEVMDSIQQYKGNWLALDGLGISDAQALELARIFEGNTILESLYLSNNNIGDSGMMAIGAALSSNQSQNEKKLSQKYVITRHEDFLSKKAIHFSRDKAHWHEYVRIKSQEEGLALQRYCIIQ